MTPEVIYAIYGDEPIPYLRASMRALRRHVFPVRCVLYTNKQVELKGFDAVEIYNIDCNMLNVPKSSITDMIRFQALLKSTSDLTCYLDNDIYVVSKYFIKGFELAKRFGMCMAMNPRLVIMSPHGNGDVDLGWKYSNKADDVMIQRDMRIIGDTPMMWTSVNNGVIFFNTKHKQARRFVELVLEELAKGFSRGQTATVRAILRSDWHPYVLTPHWCADNPMQSMLAMHVGGKYHVHMLEHYNQYFRA